MRWNKYLFLESQIHIDNILVTHSSRGSNIAVHKNIKINSSVHLFDVLNQNDISFRCSLSYLISSGI
jgi:hypothetical protein